MNESDTLRPDNLDDKKREVLSVRASYDWQINLCAGGGCLASGEPELKAGLRAAIDRHGVDALIRETGCQGPCSGGPVVTVIPGNVMYFGMTPDRAEEFVTRHLMQGELLKDLLPESSGGGKAVRREDAAFFNGQRRVVLEHCGSIDPLDIEEYIAVGGYSALAALIQSADSQRVFDELKRSGLRGRGGAGFPTWKKWEFTRSAPGERKVVLCNADEGDPGAFMDRSVLEGDPHRLIEGMAIAAYCVGADRGYVYVRAEYPLAVSRLEHAIQSAASYGCLGDGVLGSDWSFNLEIRMGSGAFVCGEETALIASIEGHRGEPRPRPPFPAVKGLWDMPSLLNNVETYANIPPLLAMGGDEFAGIGEDGSGGTKVFALAGGVRRTGLVEVPIGTPLGHLIYEIGGGVPAGRRFKAAQIGGPSGGCVPASGLNVPLNYESLKEWGAIIGSGGLIVMDDDSCMVDVARFFLEFVQEESCGKCSPCRIGTRRMGELLDRICTGRGTEADIPALLELGSFIKDSALCGLGQTAPNPVISTIRYFRDEYERHIRDKRCDAGVCPELVRAPCQSACPASVDIPGFVALTGEGRYAEALRLHRERNPFAAVCARVCFHNCEDHCRRDGLDEPVAVRAVKRFLVDQEVTIELPEVRSIKAARGVPVAIVGAGPAGLSCAYFLARLGYRPTVFEAQPRPGGMLVQAIPEYRLPREVVAREIRMIESLGVEIRTDCALGRDISLEQVSGEYRAIYLAIGAALGSSMGLPGEEAAGVIQALDFLRQYNIRGSARVGRRVVIVGGGNAAIDAARTAMRLGAEEVTVVYRRNQEQMPAYAEEVEEALHEGVKIRPLMQPMAFLSDSSGHVRAVRCMAMVLGEFDRSGRRRPEESGSESVEIEADQVILATGQRINAEIFSSVPGLSKTEGRFIAVDPTSGATGIPGIFAGGDGCDGPSSVVEAIAAGERAAGGIHYFITGESELFWRKEHFIETEFDPEAEPSAASRENIPVIPPDRRRHNFDEVERPWSIEVASRQAKRCLRCDYGKCENKTPSSQRQKEMRHA
jgi:NADH-quinone oxidoreductase subunit F